MRKYDTLLALLLSLMLIAAPAGCTVEHKADATIWRFLSEPQAPTSQPWQSVEGLSWGPARTPDLDANEYQ